MSQNYTVIRRADPASYSPWGGAPYAVAVCPNCHQLSPGLGYSVACAVARRLNGHDPEADDMDVLVSYVISCCVED